MGPHETYTGTDGSLGLDRVVTGGAVTVVVTLYTTNDDHSHLGGYKTAKV